MKLEPRPAMPEGAVCYILLWRVLCRCAYNSNAFHAACSQLGCASCCWVPGKNPPMCNSIKIACVCGSYGDVDAHCKGTIQWGPGAAKYRVCSD